MAGKLLTLREAAARLNVSVATLKRYIYEGKIRSAKLPGGHHRIPEEEVARVVSAGGTEADAAAATIPTDAEQQQIEVIQRWLTELDAEVERLSAAVGALAAFCGKATGFDVEAHELASPGHHEVLVLGTGCKRCEQLYRMVGESLQQIGRTEVGLRHVKDPDEIASFGPVLTPALVIDGEVVLSGRVPTEAALKDLLASKLA